MIREEFWAGKTVLVTGHTGFKGAWLTAWLNRLGARVIGYALPPPTRPALYDILNLHEVCESHIADIRDLSSIRRVIDDNSPEIIIHLAAQPLVLESYADPVATYQTNTMGTVHVLECARLQPSVRAVVVVTSDKCYRDQALERGYREDDTLGGADPYSSSKACAELVTDAYRSSFRSDNAAPRIATVRAGNVIGGGDWGAHRLLPDLVRAASGGTPIRLRHPHAVRPWQFVLDPLCGYLALAQRLFAGELAVDTSWNFGPEDGCQHTVGEVINMFERYWGSPISVEQLAAPTKKETATLRVDSGRARSVLGWTTRLPFAQTLEWTSEWYRTHYADPNAARQLALDQLEAYSKLR